jgi:hypothetical protein
MKMVCSKTLVLGTTNGLCWGGLIAIFLSPFHGSAPVRHESVIVSGIEWDFVLLVEIVGVGGVDSEAEVVSAKLTVEPVLTVVATMFILVSQVVFTETVLIGKVDVEAIAVGADAEDGVTKLAFEELVTAAVDVFTPSQELLKHSTTPFHSLWR